MLKQFSEQELLGKPLSEKQKAEILAMLEAGEEDIDYYGRQASCVPASGSYFLIGNTLIQCVTGGTGSPYDPGYCNFNYPVGAPLSGGVNLTTADLSLGPCQQVSPTPAGEIVLSGGTFNQNLPCVQPTRNGDCNVLDRQQRAVYRNQRRPVDRGTEAYSGPRISDQAIS